MKTWEVTQILVLQRSSYHHSASLMDLMNGSKYSAKVKKLATSILRVNGLLKANNFQKCLKQKKLQDLSLSSQMGRLLHLFNTFLRLS